MRICLLTSQDLDADPFPDDDWPNDPRPFFPEAEWHVEVLKRKTGVKRVIDLSRRGFDLFFNMCDGALDEPYAGVEVVRVLERLGVAFTGPSSAFYEPSREVMKRACQRCGLDYPAYVMARTPEDIERAAESLTFPLIVKHPNSYASIDLTPDSRVTHPIALREEAELMIEKHTAALIEEFIEGEEYSVLVAENAQDPTSPVAYTPVRFGFPEGHSFKHSDMKWVDFHDMETVVVDDAELDARLRSGSCAFFKALGGVSFGRVDMRVDSEGRIFMLEMNPNCGIYYPPEDAGCADLCLMNDEEGHEGFTRRLVEAALARHEKLARSWVVRPSVVDGFGLQAIREIDEGSVVVRHEDQGLRTVHLARSRGAEVLAVDDTFLRSAWPLTDAVWMAWSQDPAEWCPINHSCEPNAWLDGLDLVARRDIAIGEEITIDYATLFTERMPSFGCLCGEDTCRGEITGDDHLRPAVGRYGTHVSDHIQSKRTTPARSRRKRQPAAN